jgi:hypothetical protein
MDEPPGKPSFWTSLPGVLTGAAALVTALAGALALFIGNRAPATDQATASLTAEQPAQRAAASPPAAPAGAAAQDTACYATHLAGVPQDHRKELQAGAADRVLIGATESKSGVFAVRLSDGDEPLGLLRLRVRAADGSFRIEDVVDAECRSVVDVANVSRGGDPRVLQNWDEARLRVADRSFLLRLGYAGGEVTVGYFRPVVE